MKIRTILLPVFATVTLGTGALMLWLWQQERLWGYLPLLLFGSAWASLVLIFWNRYTHHPKGRRWLGLSTLSGVLLAAGFPPSPFTMLLFVAWVPLLVVEREVALARAGVAEGKKPPGAYKYIFHALVLWNILPTWWVANTAFVAGIVAVWLNAFFMSAPVWLFIRTKQVLPKVAYGAFIVYWISFEKLHLSWELTWPWLNIGNAFAQFPQWIQWYEYTGAFGGTLWVLAANVLLFSFLRENGLRVLTGQWRKWPLVGWALVVLVPIAVSLVMYWGFEEKGRRVEVLVIQPNYEPHYEKFNVSQEDQLRNFMELTEGAITPATQYIVYPETSFESVNLYALNSNQPLSALNRMMARHPGAVLVTGVGAYKILHPEDPLTRATRSSEKNQVHWEAYNAAIQLRHDADSIPVYLKSKLVPGAEILPYPNLFFFFKPLADKLGGAVEGLGTQPQREAFESPNGRVAPVICYESVFGDYHAGYVRAGAEAIFVMTNDGWWDNTPGHKQHLRYASLRAIETRRPVARAANTGISCFINQRGDILQPTRYGEKAAIRGTIRFNDEITFYVHWGDLIARIGVFTTAIFLLNTFVKGFLQRKNAGDMQVKILGK